MAIVEGLDAKKILEQIDKLPVPARFGILAGVAAVLVAVYWFTIFSSTRQNLGQLKSQLTQIESDIVEAKTVASNLTSFQEKQKELEGELRIALQQLPNSSELPVLLTDITSLGKKSGLEIHQFRPSGEIQRGFYAEVPIALKLYGAYHDIGVFFDRLSKLSRIVNITELGMKLSEYRNDTPRLEVTGVATTYFFVDVSRSAGGE
jgi:type IV pilus assembly protein PilO